VNETARRESTAESLAAARRKGHFGIVEVERAGMRVEPGPAIRVVCPLMANKKQQLDSLRNVALFSACSNKELEKVAKASDELTLPAGKVIMEQGQTGREAFIVLSGEVVVKRNNRKVATIDAGGVVGELSLLDKGPRTATATCQTECTFLVIDHRRFGAVVDSIPSISKKLMASLAGRIRELDRHSYG